MRVHNTMLPEWQQRVGVIWLLLLLSLTYVAGTPTHSSPRISPRKCPSTTSQDLTWEILDFQFVPHLYSIQIINNFGSIAYLQDKNVPLGVVRFKVTGPAVATETECLVSERVLDPNHGTAIPEGNTRQESVSDNDEWLPCQRFSEFDDEEKLPVQTSIRFNPMTAVFDIRQEWECGSAIGRAHLTLEDCWLEDSCGSDDPCRLQGPGEHDLMVPRIVTTCAPVGNSSFEIQGRMIEDDLGDGLASTVAAGRYAALDFEACMGIPVLPEVIWELEDIQYFSYAPGNALPIAEQTTLEELIFYNNNSFNNYNEFSYIIGQSVKPLGTLPSHFNVSISDWSTANNQWMFTGATYLQETRARLNASDSFRLDIDQRYFCFDPESEKRIIKFTVQGGAHLHLECEQQKMGPTPPYDEPFMEYHTQCRLDSATATGSVVPNLTAR